MSDSVANLTVKVDVKSVAAATKALESLASAAKAVETKINGLGGKATGLGKAQGDAAEGTKKAAGALAAMEKRIDAATRRYDDTIRMISRANISERERRSALDFTNAAFERHIRVIRNANAGTLELQRTNIAFKNSVLDVRDSVKLLERQEAQRIAAARKNAKELETIEKKRVADSIALQSRLQQAQGSVQGITLRAGRQLSPEAASGITRQAEVALARYTTALNTYGVRSLEAGRAAGAFGMTMRGLSSEIARVGGLLPRISDNARVFSAAFGAANASLGGFSRVLFNTLPAVQALLGAFALREITQSIMEFERFTNTLKTVSGSAGEFNRNLGFLFAEANRIGFAVGEVGNSFARLSLAMKGTGFSADESKTAFSQLAEASRNFGLSSADTMGVIRALEQSMSKGKFMAEEVRLQLGDRLPIAMAALDKAVTVVDGRQADLNKRFEEGSLDVKRYGTEFIRQINLMSGGAETLARTQGSIAAALGRLNNELTLVTKTFGEGGFTNAVVIATQNFIAFLQTLREIGAIDAAGAVMEALAKQTALLSTAIAGLALALSASLIAKFARFAVTLNPWGRAIGLILTAITAFVGLSEAINKPQRALNNLTAAGNDFNRAFDRAKGASEEFRSVLAASNTTTRAAVTEMELIAEAHRRVGKSEVEVTRIVGEETLKRMALAEKELERTVKTQQDAISVRRNAVLAENEDIKKAMMLFNADMSRLMFIQKLPDDRQAAYKEEEELLQKTAKEYANVIGILEQYISTSIDEETTLKRLAAEWEKHPALVDAAMLVVAKNTRTLEGENKALKANLERRREIRREIEATAALVAQPEAALAAFNAPGEVVGLSKAQVEEAKKMASTLEGAIKKFQDKYGDDKFIAQAKAVETVLTAAKQKFADYGIAANASSSDILVALAANEAFAKSFPELADGVRRFAAEIDKARNPHLAQIVTINDQIIQNEKLIASYSKGGNAVAEAQIALQAHNEAMKASGGDVEKYTKLYDAFLASLGFAAEQQNKIAALDTLKSMENELALLDKEISLRGQSVAVQEEELAVTRALQSVKTTDPKILADIENNTRAISQRREALDEAKNGVDAYVAATKIEIQEQEKVIQAYRLSRAHVMEAEIAQKAHTEALRFGAYMSAEYTAALEKLLPLLREKADQDRSAAAASSIRGMRDEVALLETQVALLGKSREEREKGLAVYLAQKAAEGGDVEEAERLALRTLELRKQLAEADRPENVREEKYTDTLNAQISAHEGIAAAYRISTQAGEERELQLKAETEAIRLSKDGQGDYEEILKNLLNLLPKVAAGEASIRAAKDLPQMRDEIALLEKEQSLLGESVALREQELAVFRALQQNRGAKAQDLAEIERNTRRTVELRQQNQFLENSYNELANIGTRAFEQVGDAITEAFSKGELRALRFGDIVRGVMSSIIQSIIRLGIINPILNNLFPGGEMRPTFGGAMTAAAGGSGGGGSILSGLGQIFSAGRTVLSTGSLLGGAGGFAGYGAGMSGVLFGTPAVAAASPAALLAAGEPAFALSGISGTSATSGLLGSGGQFSMAALGSTLGLAAGGFGAGTFANSLLGGNQTSGMIGSAIGTGIGLALTPILGPFAPILGGLIGGAGGGMIGPKPSSKGFSYNLGTEGGRLAPIDYRYFNEQGRAQFQEAEAGVASTNALLQQFGLTATGGRAVGGNRFGMGNLGYGEAASFSEAFKSLQFAATSNEELSRALSTRAFEGVEKLQEFLQGFVGLQETIKSLTADPVPEFKQQMDALIDSFAQATAKAREYGIGEEELLAARDKQIAKLEEQRSLTIRDTALEMHVRRLMAEGMDQEAQRIELAYKTQKEIESFTASLETLGITAGEKSRLLIELERTQAAERVKILKDANKNIRDYLDSLRTSSPLSGTTTMGRLSAAQELFNRDLAAAQTGNVDALNRITQSADTLLNLAREAYASTGGFHDIRGRVVSGLESLATTPMSQQSLPDLASVPLVAEMTNLRTNAAIAETAEYTKRFDSKLAELLPIAEDIKQAVEQSKEAAVALYDYVSAGGGGDVDGDISGPPGPDPTGELFALGGVFRHGRVTAYANGGVPDYVNSPTMAPMALFGEAGPEAIMPLRRGSDGRLGVEVNGEGSQAVVAELRAVRQEIVNLRGSVEESDNDGGGGVVEAIAELRIQIGGLREELRTNRLRAQ